MKTILALSASIFLMGCLESPLLNHATASPQPIPVAQPTENAKVAACPLAFPAQKLCASLTWVRMPVDEEDKGEFTLRFWKQDEGTESGPYVTPAYKVGVKLWMATMGHGSSPVTVSPALDSSGAPIPGVFRATDVYFVMGGAWEIWVQLKENRQIVEQAKVDFEV